MIIKSMARKAPTFKQLVDYIGRDAAGKTHGTFARNLYHGGNDSVLVAEQFYQNHHWLPERKNGNALYHEVIVLEPQEHLTKKRVSEILVELAEDYCKRRAPEQLAWGQVHLNTDYPHIHLMLSANAVRSSKRVRLEKTSFAQIQRDLEQYKFRHFPELQGLRVYANGQQRQTPKITRIEGEQIRRTGSASNKQQVHQILQTAFGKASGLNDLKTHLRLRGFDLYQRGKTHGVKCQKTGRKYRFKTLGLNTAFENIISEKPKSKPEPDKRAEALLKSREKLERAAEQQLSEFDRHNEGQER
jgi:hypothetical protein